MKPQSPEINLRHAGGQAAKGAFPRTDFEYYSATLPSFRGGCARSGLCSFRKISADYFRYEAPGDFRQEMIAFAAIFVTAAIPMLNNMHALAEFLRSVGTL